MTCLLLLRAVISRAMNSNMTIVFIKTLPNDDQIRYFYSQILSFIVFHETLHFEKLESANFKYDNSFLNCCPKQPNKTLGANFFFFFFLIFMFVILIFNFNLFIDLMSDGEIDNSEGCS